VIENGIKTTTPLEHGQPLIEDTIQNGVKNTWQQHRDVHWQVEDTIINGVKNTTLLESSNTILVEDTIQNGVKKTYTTKGTYLIRVEDTIQNGVKKTDFNMYRDNNAVEDTIENGVKNTVPMGTDKDSIISNDFGMNDTIKNGVKEIIGLSPSWVTEKEINNTIQNGVKTKPALESHEGFMGGTPYVDKFFSKEDIEDTIENGVKETKKATHGSSWIVEDAIQNGVKETSYHGFEQQNIVEDAIQNGVKEIKTDDSYRNYFKQSHKSEKVIENGVKLTESWRGDRDPIINKIIKETKTPGEDGDILGAVDFMSDNNTVNIPQLIDDVIKNGIKRTEGGILFDETKVDRIISEGVKETKGGGYLGVMEMNGKLIHMYESPKQNEQVEGVIKNGIKETHDDVYHHKGRVDGVIKNGVKEVNSVFRKIINPMNFETVIIEEKRIDDVTCVIRDGIKEVKELPDQSGELRGYGDYYYRQVDFTKPHTKYVDDVIESGIKKTKPMV